VFKMIVDMASEDTGVAARALAQVIEAEDAQVHASAGEPAAGRQSRRTSSRTREAPSSVPRSTRKRRIVGTCHK
jgi:hypothetical protein